ncbi:hypothetical protein B0J11DRAFT_14366 [Dendryphion nanum]|uniref:Zn(2)-C6 fungal-type domain-containing protein n=1 Tax=Dendryphion nanum TaxID=256645 RepID=A0A9P9EJS6_9PLEO|nr:hypothetical protein B0J11DRAFT_14366 [Dendryphion nanum]
MELESFPRYSQPPPMNFPIYCQHERNVQPNFGLARPDPRTCPINGPRGRGSGREEDNGGTRRRIAVACARCRKRKIRCSGDPGNGLGCLNCKSAGVDLSHCQFHRVGSREANDVMFQQYMSGFSHSIPGHVNPDAMMPLYTPSNTTGTKAMSSANNCPTLDTKTMFPQGWTVPFSEDTSPIDTYNLDQSSAYIPSQNTMTHLYNPSYRWNQASQRATQSRQYLGHDMPSSYMHTGISYLQTSGISPTVTGDAISPLNMTSMGSALPMALPERSRPHHSRVSDTLVPQQRQLPIPHPSPAPTTKNLIDKIQLRNTTIMSETIRSRSSTNSTAFGKSATWNPDTSGTEGHRGSTSEASDAERLVDVAASAPINTTTSSVVNLLPISTLSTDGLIRTATEPQLNFATNIATESRPSFATTTQGQLNFSTNLLDTVSPPTPSATYSNIRGCPNPIPVSGPAPGLGHQGSPTHLYNFESTSKRHSQESSSNEGTLVNGQLYTPLGPPKPPRRSPFDSRHHGMESRAIPTHRASTSNLNRGY